MTKTREQHRAAGRAHRSGRPPPQHAPSLLPAGCPLRVRTTDTL